jgi:hypothetical protein
MSESTLIAPNYFDNHKRPIGPTNPFERMSILTRCVWRARRNPTERIHPFIPFVGRRRSAIQFAEIVVLRRDGSNAPRPSAT